LNPDRPSVHLQYCHGLDLRSKAGGFSSKAVRTATAMMHGETAKTEMGLIFHGWALVMPALPPSFAEGFQARCHHSAKSILHWMLPISPHTCVPCGNHPLALFLSVTSVQCL
jgi:hypothetical protein